MQSLSTEPSQEEVDLVWSQLSRRTWFLHLFTRALYVRLCKSRRRFACYREFIDGERGLRLARIIEWPASTCWLEVAPLTSRKSACFRHPRETATTNGS